MAATARSSRRYSVIESASQERHHLANDAHLTCHSQDDSNWSPVSFFVDVPATLHNLMNFEDGDKHITIDKGPKALSLGSLDSGGYHRYTIRGTYLLSNLLQELTQAQEIGLSLIALDSSILREDPVQRLRRKVRDVFWPGLIRRLDANVIELATRDTKVETSHARRIYVPSAAQSQLLYFSKIAEQQPEINLEVIPLPKLITTDVYRTLLDKPGLLALDIEDYFNEATGRIETIPVPFIVPGGRFNEFFGWDSYFMGLGLLIDGRLDIVKGIIRNWVFEIQHYGIIPNANRSYFLSRSQPPFLTDLSIRLYKTIIDQLDAKAFLKLGIQAAIKEYHGVWVKAPRLDPITGLSKYSPNGVGIPLEVEPGHFDNVLKPFAQKHDMTITEFTTKYNQNMIDEPDLEEYLRHDRGVRESGHDTSARLEGRAANLAITDLNFCLYKYEKDIAYAIREVFDDEFDIDQEFALPSSADDVLSSNWEAKAEKRKAAIDKYLWNEERGSYFDYDVCKQQKISSESVTCLWALWCGVASAHQAELLVSQALPQFECLGGLATSSKATEAAGSSHNHQWDYPFGWAPHQIMAWDGLSKYGYQDEASRLAYRWLSTIMKVFVDYNGAIVEKYDVTRVRDPHRVDAEYGNQGLEFHGYAREGFGWTNASFVCGMSFLSRYMQKALGVCAPYESLAK